jgi:integrase
MIILASQKIDSRDFYSRAGYQVKFDSERWQLSKDVEIPVNALKGLLTQDMYLSALHVLAFYSTSNSPSHVQNLFYRFKFYLESTTGQPLFSVESLISYRSMLDKHTEWYLGSLRGFIRKWSELGYSGVPEETIRLLNKWTIKGNEKGFAVQSMCPDSGPLTDIEMEAVIGAVITAFGEKRLTLVDTSHALILAMTGRRPTQITALKLMDLIQQSGKYFIRFPRAKQRSQAWRQSFNQFAVVEDLWVVLQQQAEAVRQQFSMALGADIPQNLIPELPLFPALDTATSVSDLKEKLISDRLHAQSDSVRSAMLRVEKTIKVISERTGEPVRLNPTRFRYTLGTNLAREGKGEYVIAEVLDHSDTQNAGVYVRNIPEIVDRIDKAVALQLAPIAQAFQGVLVVSESDAKRGDDRSSRISNGTANLGTCGSYGFCSAFAPVACYTCNHFQPWLDGPHEAVLERLISERDSVLEQTSDSKIAAVNDRLILAVGDVVNRCNAMKNEVIDG